MRSTMTRLSSNWQLETPEGFHLRHCPRFGVHFSFLITDAALSFFDSNAVILGSSALSDLDPSVLLASLGVTASGYMALINLSGGMPYSLALDVTEVSVPSVVPLPAAVWLLGAGFLGYLGIGYSRRNETA